MDQKTPFFGTFFTGRHKSPYKIYIYTVYMLKNQAKTKHSEYYQRNKERRKAEQREYYAKKKKQEQLSVQKYYHTNSIKVLLSLKEYTELNREKMKLWLDFNWTIQDCQKTGFFDIVQIQQLEQLAGNLTRDYYQTAKKKSKSSWNSLSEQEQSKLIKYWAREKMRKEQELAVALTEQEEKGQEYEKELELAKFHEERGKIKCICYDCENKKAIQGEIKEQLFKDETEQTINLVKGECANCYEYKKVDEESGLCRKCSKD